MGPAFTALETAFKATPAGQGVTFTNSFGASTTQAEDVVAGQPADVTVFSDVPDLNLLVAAGLVSKSWASYPAAAAEKGFVTDSVVSLIVRPGNPLGITGWNSLTKSGVQIVTPDPISSGSARWNLLAAYESQIQQKKSATSAKNFVNSLVANVVSEPSSGSKALTTFLSGTGNVLLDYEADAMGAQAAGEKIQIVNPAQNTLIQNPAALTTSGTSNPAAVSFFDYMFSQAGQSIWVHEGFRATLKSVAVREEDHLLSARSTRDRGVARRMGQGHRQVLLVDGHRDVDRKRARLHQLTESPYPQSAASFARLAALCTSGACRCVSCAPTPPRTALVGL